ncbi:DHH family phosphoesterase [Eubacterium oxidoreducens]|uniref:C-di-AMP phosphodiesterase, consists of a GGDEF-like and DHH domains n=1 Tax=Eubacterium oxidoreducens TaxID=1732 RepID=A0A1G5ZZS4_EUBOX|nr:DHH family phosphoesterase [Eubacterium oxidoreducens]SDB01667.1 c-di-AMP phosphodiesterase, consists of a GGDEF-like and DHH domains [Eubacterium oxidoreducens]
MGKQNELTASLRAHVRWPLQVVIIFVVADIISYFLSPYAGAVGSIAIGIYLVFTIPAYIRSKKQIQELLVEFATHYGTMQKRLLNEFEVPYALLDENGKILWMNKKFQETSGRARTYHKSINAIIGTITKEWLQRENVYTMEQHINLGDRDYRASIQKVFMQEVLPQAEGESQGSKDIKQQRKDYIFTLYLFDETRLNEYIRKNEEQRLVSALVYIDNYDEVLDKTADMKSSMVSAIVTRQISDYFSKYDAIVRRTERDKFYVVFKYANLQSLIEDKFSLIESVKKIKAGNEMSLTLSIGIGVNKTTYVQNYEYARMAIDLALGRGGDQVVIKNGDQISYFGGKTQQIEVNTRVKARVKAHALREIIESHEHILIMGHKIGDVDSFGAAIGLYVGAKALGRTPKIVLNEVTSSLKPFKEFFTEENGYEENMFINGETAIDFCDAKTVVIVVDTNRPAHTECEEILKKSKTVVVFDHHRQGNERIENAVLSYIESYASSTCEMVAEILQYLTDGIKLNHQEADSIYAGILIDTNNFMTKTGVRTFEAAAYLRRSGAEVTRVRKLLRNDMNDYKARAEAVRHAQVYKGVFAISICPADELESPTVVGAQAANELLNIIGIKASFVLTEYNDKIYISSRSIDEINVQLIMERLGGGGHLSVAGAQLEHATLEDAEEALKMTLNELIEEGQITL